jgi:hypothetical protein
MAYTIADFPQLQTSLLGAGSLWHMLKKDLLQITASPSYFDQATQSDLGCGPNLSLMMVAVGGLETMATLANIDGLVGMNATDMVKRFAERYFPAVNPLYTRPAGESLPALIWDAYRNGGLHKYFPKKDTIAAATGQVSVTFGLSWPETAPPDPKRSLSLDEMRRRRATTPALGGPGSKHLAVEVKAPGAVNVWVCAPYFTLELVGAVEKWVGELPGDADLQNWFVAGANKLDDGLRLGNPPGARACLTSMVDAAIAATATPVAAGH